MGDFWSGGIFVFPETCKQDTFFPLLNALQHVFFPPHLFAGFFFSSKMVSPSFCKMPLH